MTGLRLGNWFLTKQFASLFSRSHAELRGPVRGLLAGSGTHRSRSVLGSVLLLGMGHPQLCHRGDQEPREVRRSLFFSFQCVKATGTWMEAGVSHLDRIDPIEKVCDSVVTRDVTQAKKTTIFASRGKYLKSCTWLNVLSYIPPLKGHTCDWVTSLSQSSQAD